MSADSKSNLFWKVEIYCVRCNYEVLEKWGGGETTSFYVSEEDYYCLWMSENILWLEPVIFWWKLLIPLLK